jgi:hypothetical protein
LKTKETAVVVENRRQSLLDKLIKCRYRLPKLLPALCKLRSRFNQELCGQRRKPQ